ncbi:MULTISPECIES: hypothetical protein [Methylobacillus]|uniref:Transmembrane protein n=1 Tax=Methylobacillus flagellatus (strain ATCC 51484 / DSM 6875 / VKM B-1610 / KT) TaxID=265072 RepID=Q1H1D8_METFK|nr:MULTISPECIES: hypothetical protein [Methylobacillus]ABE49699.1 hypothetical protein Mfla_1431 [Methylobacillus flagellatus KT]MPS49063.1 hypothetical protein [Methylobacillus sp.]
MKPHIGLKESFTVSGFFKQQDQVDTVLTECLRLGIPRDLIDVALSEGAAAKFPTLRAKKNTDSWFAWTGRGALAGLLISSALTLGIILLMGYEVTDQMALVQLLGPDIGIIVGAALGALYGWLRESDTNVVMQRALQRDDAMLLLVYLQPPEEAKRIEKILLRHGGEAVNSQPTELSPAEVVSATR